MMLEYFEDDLDTILHSTKKCWEDKRDKTIFITGGTGFFGIWLQMSFIHINRKLQLNSKVVILTRSKSKFIQTYPWLSDFSEISFLEGDITSFEFIEEKIDYIIHAATEASVKLNLEDPLTMFETVVNGTKRVLEFAKLKQVQSVLFTSSGAVYGKQPSNIENLPESFNGAPVTSDPASVYGEGKRMGEVLCSVYHKHFNTPVKIARCYAFMGPFLPLNSHFAAGNFIRNLLNGEDIIIEGDGTPFRSYMYSADLMAWLWTILFRGENNRPYNVGSDESISISKLAEMVAKYKGYASTNVIIKTAPSNMPVLRYVPNIDRAKSELALKLNYQLEDCLTKTIDFNKTIKL